MFGASHSGSSSTKAFHWEKRARSAGRSHEAGVQWDDGAGAAGASSSASGRRWTYKGAEDVFRDRREVDARIFVRL